MKEIIVADQSAFTKAIAYDERKFPAMKEGEAIIISNSIKKTNGYVQILIDPLNWV